MPSYLLERDVLKPKDPRIKDNNDWEIFLLSNAEVRDATTGELSSLLNAHAASPVTVTGRLQAVKSEQQRLLLRSEYARSTPLQIDDVCEFCYGTDDAGNIILWAAGEAGWYELRAGRSYKDFFQSIEQAVNVQFFIEDVYEQGRGKSGGGPSADMVFRELAEDARFGCNSRRQAAELIARHRHFLLMQMFKNNGKSWGRTPLYLYLKEKFPDDFQAMKNKSDMKTSSPNVKSVTKARRQTPDDSELSMSDGQLSEQVENSGKANKPKTKSAPKKDAAYWRAKVVWELMQRAHSTGHVDVSAMRIPDIANVLYHRYELESTDIATDVIRSLAANLRFNIRQKDQRNKKSGVQWVQSPIYKELAATRLNATKLREANEMPLKPRKVPLEMELETPEEQQTPVPEADDREARLRRRGLKGKSSVLRPTSTRFSGKGKGTRNTKAPKGPAQKRSTDDDESDDDENAQISTPSKRKGDFSTDIPPNKRLTVGISDRRKSSVSVNTSSDSVPTTPSEEDGNVGDEDEDEDEDEEPDEDEEGMPPTTLPLHLRSAKKRLSSSLEVKQRIISSKLPSHEANQPGDVWLCTFDGCARRIYGASEPESLELIKEHIEKHEQQLLKQSDKVELVMQEGELGGRLPVTNLIKRIREMAAAQQSILTPSGSSVNVSMASNFLEAAVRERY